MMHSFGRALKCIELGLISMSLCLLPACGTEVGNGKAPPRTEISKSPNPMETETASPKSDKSPESIVPPPTSSPAVTMSSFLKACASPWADMVTSTFTEETSHKIMEVKLLTLSSWDILLNGQSYAIASAASATRPYAITSSTAALDASECDVSSSSENGSVKRTAVFANGSKSVWTIELGAVKKVEFYDALGTRIETWNLNAPSVGLNLKAFWEPSSQQ